MENRRNEQLEKDRLRAPLTGVVHDGGQTRVVTLAVELHKSDAAWSKSNATQLPNYKMKSFKGILNKLSKDNFDRLVEQIKDMDIDSEEELRTVVRCIYDKVSGEPFYCKLYANLCESLKSLTVRTNGEVSIDFQRILCKECKTEFDNNYGTTCNYETSTDEKTDDELTELRRLNLARLQFLGELYKAKTLKHSIAINCLEVLSSRLCDYYVEAFCHLFGTVGEALMNDDAVGESVKDQVEQKSKLVLESAQGNKEISPRIRFKVSDLLEKMPSIRNITPQIPDTNALMFRSHEESKATKRDLSKTIQKEKVENVPFIPYQVNKAKVITDVSRNNFRAYRTTTVLSRVKQPKSYSSKLKGGYLSEADIKEYILTFFDKYLKAGDLDCISSDICKTFSNGNIENFVIISVKDAINLNDVGSRHYLGFLFGKLLADEIVTHQQFCDGLDVIFRVCNQSKVEKLSEIFGPMLLVLNCNKRYFFDRMLKKAIRDGIGVMFMQCIIKSLAKILDSRAVIKLWMDGEFRWSDFQKPSMQ